MAEWLELVSRRYGALTVLSTLVTTCTEQFDMSSFRSQISFVRFYNSQIEIRYFRKLHSSFGISNEYF